MRKIPRIGRGSKMSIAKAALIYYYRELPENSSGMIDFLDYGDLEAMHRIVDIAGCKHCSMLTAAQVSSCLASSPYWDKRFLPRFYKGMPGHGGANIYTPSEKGSKYYEENLQEKHL